MLILLLIVLLAVSLMREYRQHQRALASIPVRIHVNGTRGKSSVSRLIAAGLRAGGIRTFCKTTGTAPCIIMPDGREVVIKRLGKSNIVEQVKIVSVAARCKAQALVIECMALYPHLQWFAENKMIRSTVGVITNAREDHLDVMGPTARHVALNLGNSFPTRGRVFTADERFFPEFQQIAEMNQDQISLAKEGEVPEDYMRGFTYVEHRENVALALKICESLGVARENAIQGMWTCIPDPGVLRVHRVKVGDKRIDFVNAFAANDRESTLLIMDRLGLHSGNGSRIITLLNNRPDRIQRAEQFAGMIASDIDSDYVVLVGDFLDAVVSSALRLGASAKKLVNLGRLTAEQVPLLFDKIVELTPAHSVVIGVGNIGGVGHDIVNYFERCSRNAHRPRTLN